MNLRSSTQKAPQVQQQSGTNKKSKKSLRWVALFLGELRDGLTMLNMQGAFLVVAKNYSEKQVGLLLFTFGMSQFMFQTPAGYLYDYTEQKVLWLSTAAIATTVLTILTALMAADHGENLRLMVLIKFVQGAVTSFIPPGLNSITQGIVAAPEEVLSTGGKSASEEESATLEATDISNDSISIQGLATAQKQEDIEKDIAAMEEQVAGEERVGKEELPATENPVLVDQQNSMGEVRAAIEGKLVVTNEQRSAEETKEEMTEELLATTEKVATGNNQVSEITLQQGPQNKENAWPNDMRTNICQSNYDADVLDVQQPSDESAAAVVETTIVVIEEEGKQHIMPNAVAMTKQVSINEMMNHFGTAIIVLTGSLLAFSLYPNIGLLFVVSPIACCGVLFFIRQINPEDINHDAARGLPTETKAEKKENKTNPTRKALKKNLPSFRFGWGENKSLEKDAEVSTVKAATPLDVLRNPTLLIFILAVFLFHMANATVLPLVIQTLAIGGGRTGILFSGLCIIVAQVVMVVSAKICGKYSQFYGRKPLFIIGLFTLPVRCLLLYIMLHFFGHLVRTSLLIQFIILSTQILDGVGAGVFGTMYILVSSDVSAGTGRFSLILGMTTAAVSIGSTVSGYVGEALAQDLGYTQTYLILMCMSMIPAFLYLFCMPETLPAYVKKSNQLVSEKAPQNTGIQEEHHAIGDISV